MYQSDISKWCIQTVETPAGLIPLVQSSKCCCHRTEQSGIAAGLQSRCGGAALSPVHRELQEMKGGSTAALSALCLCQGSVRAVCGCTGGLKDGGYHGYTQATGLMGI